MSTVILGASGFLGPQLLDRYPDVISVGRTQPRTGNKHVHCESLDDIPRVLDTIEFDKMIMMIGSSNHGILNHGDDHLMAIEKNVIPLKRVFNYLRTRKIKKVISFSSILLYDRTKMILPADEGQPINPYQNLNEYIFSKYLGEEVARYYAEIPNIIVRLTNIYGPTTALGRPDLVNQIVEGLVFEGKASVLNPSPQRDFIYTADAADAIVKLLDTNYTGPINVASGKMHSVGQLCDILEKVSGIKIERGNGPTTGHPVFVADISLLKNLTGWEPQYSLEQGLEETYSKMIEMYGKK